MKPTRDGVGACRQAAVAFCMVAIGLPLPLVAQQTQEGQQEVSYSSLDFPMADAMNNWGVSTQEELDSLFGDYFPGGGIIFVPDGHSRLMILIDPNAPLDEGFFPEDSPLTEQEKALEYFRQNAVAESSFYVIGRGSESHAEGITLTVVAGSWASSEKYVMGVELSFGASFGIFMPLQIEDEYALAAASMEEVVFPVLEKVSDGVPFDIPGDGGPPDRQVSLGGAGGGNAGGALCDSAAAACRATARADHATKYHDCCANYWTLVVACSVGAGASMAIPILGPWIGIFGGVICVIGAAALLEQCINAERMVLRAKLMTCRVGRTACCMKPGVVCNPINN